MASAVKIKLATVMAGPEGCFPIGHVVTVEDEETALALLNAGGTIVEEVGVETGEGESGDETATAAPNRRNRPNNRQR